MSKPLDVSNFGAEAKPARLPPIRILDMLVLTATMAFIFMLQDKMSRIQAFPETNSVFHFAFQLAYAFPSGASLASIFWLIVQKRITGRFFHQPGHWMLAGFMVITSGSYIVVFGLLSDRGDADFENPFVLFVTLTAIQLGAFVFLVFAAFHQSGIWRWALGMVAATFLATGLSYVLTLFMFSSTFGFGPSMMFLIGANQIVLSVAYILAVILLIVAATSDRRKSVSRDWLHWVGVLVVLIHLIVLPIMLSIMSYLVNQSQSNGA